MNRCFFTLYRPCEEKEQCDFQSPYQKKAQGSSHPFDDGAHQQGAKGRTSQEYEGIESHNAAQEFLGRCHLDHRIAVHNEGDNEKAQKAEKNQGRNEIGYKAHCHEEQAAEDGGSENHPMGQMIPGCSCQKAADHGTGTGCEKNGAEAVNTGMKHPVCKERCPCSV